MKLYTLLVLILFVCGCGQQSQPRNIDSFQLTAESLFSAQFSQDAQWVSVYTSSKTIEVWDITSRTKKVSLPLSTIGEVARAMSLANTKQQLFVAGEQRVSVWSISDGKLLQYYNITGADPLARISSMALSPNDQHLAIGMNDGSVVLMSFATKQLRLFKPHNAEVAELIWNKHSTEVLSGGLDGVVARWSVADVKTLTEYQVAKRVTALTVDANFELAFVSDSLSDQHIVDIGTGEKLAELSYAERFRWFRNAYLFAEQPYLVTSSSKTQLYIWNKNTGALLKSFHIDAQDKEALVLALTKKSSTSLQTISSEGIIEFWEIPTLVLN